MDSIIFSLCSIHACLSSHNLDFWTSTMPFAAWLHFLSYFMATGFCSALDVCWQHLWLEAVRLMNKLIPMIRVLVALWNSQDGDYGYSLLLSIFIHSQHYLSFRVILSDHTMIIIALVSFHCVLPSYCVISYCPWNCSVCQPSELTLLPPIYTREQVWCLAKFSSIWNPG